MRIHRIKNILMNEKKATESFRLKEHIFFFFTNMVERKERECACVSRELYKKGEEQESPKKKKASLILRRRNVICLLWV